MFYLGMRDKVCYSYSGLSIIKEGEGVMGAAVETAVIHYLSIMTNNKTREQVREEKLHHSFKSHPKE